MTTSEGRPYKLVFFKKDDCGPCVQVMENLQKVLFNSPEYSELVTVMQKENHSALVAAYELSLYPTVLILDKGNNEISRKIGAKFLTQEWWESALSRIYALRSSQAV